MAQTNTRTLHINIKAIHKTLTQGYNHYTLLVIGQQSMKPKKQ